MYDVCKMAKLWWWTYAFMIGLVCSRTQVCCAGKPNIIVMVADDMGYGDLGCYGNTTIRTPNIDRIAEEGAKLTHALATASVCTPSRAALMTGRYQIRSGMASPLTLPVLPWLAVSGGLPPAEITFGELTKQSGYQNGFIGKWHLGVSKEQIGDYVHHPLNQGFDYFYGNLVSNMDDFGDDGVKMMELIIPNYHWQLLAVWSVTVVSLVALYKAGHLSLVVTATLAFLWAIPLLYVFFIFDQSKLLNSMLHRNFDVVEQPIQLVGLSKRFVQEGTEFMSRAVESQSPFLLVMSWFHTHTALSVSKEFEGRSKRGIYGDAMEEMDWSVGKVLDHLDNLGERNNTIVMFVSDHGGHVELGHLGGYNGIFRGGKTHGAPEGAIRVPWVIRWHGVVPPGVVIDEPVSLMDIFPLVGQAAGVPLPTDRNIDGRDILPMLQGKERVSPHEFLFHYCGDKLHATRYRPKTGDSHWKLVTHVPSYLPGKDHCRFVCHCNDAIRLGVPRLYDIRTDPRELAPIDPHSDVYTHVRAVVEEAVEAHRNSIGEVETQFKHSKILWRYSLQECCPGPFPFKCDCNDSKFSADMYE